MRAKRKPSTPSPKRAPSAQPKLAAKRTRAPGAGRPPGTGYHPSPEQRDLVTVMAAMGIPEEHMVAAVLNPKSGQPISPVTLRKHFRKELDQGFVRANAKVGASLFKNATTPTDAYPGGVPIAQLFWLKCRARWQQHPEKIPPPPSATPEAMEMDPKELARRMAFLLARGAASRDREEAPPTPAAPTRRIKLPA